MKTGRNEPCPCGSGKKFKHCCLSVTNGIPRTITDELQDLLSGQEFDSIEEVQAVAEMLMANQNQKLQDDFLGLSSDQVYRMLNYPYDTPELFQFPNELAIQPEAPVLMLIEGVVSAIDGNGLKATKTKGNLPQKLCREVWSDYCKIHPHKLIAAVRTVNKEDDFFELHVARIVLELAGFVRKAKGRFYLTRKYQTIRKQSGLKGLYPILFDTYCREFNWAYWDGYSDAPFIQQSFLFTLYLLKHHGEKMTFTTVYEDDFLRAFPMVLDQMDGSTYSTPEEDFRRCYYYRAHEHLLVFFGLAELEVIQHDQGFNHKYKIKKTPLFDAVVQFNL